MIWTCCLPREECPCACCQLWRCQAEIGAALAERDALNQQVYHLNNELFDCQHALYVCRLERDAAMKALEAE